MSLWEAEIGRKIERTRIGKDHSGSRGSRPLELNDWKRQARAYNLVDCMISELVVSFLRNHGKDLLRHLHPKPEYYNDFLYVLRVYIIIPPRNDSTV